MDDPTLIVLGGVAVVVGALIGCIGVGGVLLVPALTYLGGIDIHVAIASCMVSYLFGGVVGAYQFARRGSLRWQDGGWLCVGAMPGAFVGSAAAVAVGGVVLEMLIMLVVVLGGLNGLRQPGPQSTDGALPAPPVLVAVGLVTGVGSAMTGTGGPLLLVPLLLWLGVPVLTAVGLSQFIQVPISALATAGNFAFGRVDFVLGLAIAVLLMVGVSIGVRVAHRVSLAALRRFVSFGLLGVGVLIAVRLIGVV